MVEVDGNSYKRVEPDESVVTKTCRNNFNGLMADSLRYVDRYVKALRLKFC